MNLRKAKKAGIPRLELTYDETLQENEYQVNRLSGWLALLSPIGATIALLLNYFGVFILDNVQSSFVMILMFPFFLASFLVGAVLGIKKPWVKYFLMVNECILVMILYSFLSMHVVLWLAVPMVKSCLYFNRKLTKITFFCSSAAMLAAHLLSVPLSIVPTDTLAEDLYSAIVYAFIPRYLEYLIFSAAAILISRNSSTLIQRTYLYADRNKKLMEDMRSSRYEIVKNLGIISDNKSKDTGEHIARVFEYMKVLAAGCGYSAEEINDIALAAMLHDIGKLAIDDRVLSKPGKLTDDEFAEIKQHVSLGHDLLVNSSDSVMQTASVIAMQHHERWDGKGYLGIKGKEIDPLSRMMSIVDVFDALTSKRCYKQAWSLDAAYQEILKGRGTQFDPAVVDVFIKNYDRFCEICRSMNPDCTE